jgi:ornithine decarboxylase
VGGGNNHYDVASHCRSAAGAHKFLPEAKLCFMHPVKAERSDCRGLSQSWRATLLSLDTPEELDKIVRATRKRARDRPELCVRIRVSSDHSKLSLAAKFGAEPSEVADLLIATRQAADAPWHLLSMSAARR